MRVCFIAGTLGRGGAERQLLFMLRALIAEGIDARVLCLTEGEAFEKEIRELGISVDFIGRSQSRSSRLRELIQNVRKLPTDALQSAHFFTNIYAAVASRFLGIPSIGAIRGDLSQAIASNGLLGNLQLKFPKHLIANSRAAVAEAITRGIDQKNIDLVRNVVDSNGDTADENKTDRDCINILFAGRLVSVKRPDTFLRLAAELRSRLSGVKLNFHIAGDGPLRSTLEELASDLGLLRNGVSFLGERAEMNQVYRDTDILVLTSDHEGTPNVILEAMAHGVPVVAAGVGGVTEILDEERGRLVQPGDFEGLVQETSTLVCDPVMRRRMGNSGRKYVGEDHSICYLRARLLAIYGNLSMNS